MGDQGQIRKLSQMLTRIKPYLAIVALQFGYAGMFIVVMVSLKRGMNNYVLVVYRHAVATLVITPFALVLERKTRPKMTLSIFLKIVVLGFLEPVLDQNLYYLGMKYTSATFASAIVNVLPALTFIMAIIFRLEKVNFKQMHSLAKVIGTTITVSGAMVMTLYKGPIVDIIWYSHSTNHHKTTTNSTSDQHWVTGTIMLLASTGGWSGFFILQSITLKQYPAELSLTALICLMGMVEGAAAALVMERDMGAWVIGFDSRLLAAVYSGVVCSGIAYYVQGVVNKVRGPVFVTAFSPLCMIITAALGAIVLAEQVHLGSLIGAIIVVFGLYSVVWGKSKDPLNSEALTFETGKAYELPVVDTNKSTIVDDDDAHKSKFSGKNALPQQP
ncbi:WAT1-related protein At4g08300-like [Actinidia eriantha]|uniref:WAT1-related protein At4g08300-like n=1 Tax=Actinidia eriantha TaxID=165200 RepID=UPI0025870DB5|nr:WAT1-related protein At4g08300-like [Actinidia eriantha]XP_057502823.1 WAT1-related protein At4g08300-like [Actinidia eriantha]